MAERIQRNTQKIFAGNASIDELAVFGSMTTGNPIYTDNIETLQSTDYEEGWSSAIAANEAPFLEEMNGVQYGLSKQIAYQFQEGVPEYDPGTTYFTGSWCKSLTNNADDQRDIYQSLTDNNLGNPLTDSINWKKVEFGGANKDLSNLSASGQAIIDNKANIDLSNLSETGQALFNGVWVKKHKELLVNISCNGTSDLNIDLSNYLPSDGNAYEIMLSGWVNYDSIALHPVECNVYSSLGAAIIAHLNTTLNQGFTIGGNTILPVAEDRIFRLKRQSTIYGTVNLNVDAYRKIRS